MEALFAGPLVVRDGCVLVGRPGEYSVPIWPNGFTAEEGTPGLVVLDERGRLIAAKDETFEMGGGYVAEFEPEDTVEPRAAQLSRVEEALGYSIPERCLGPEVYGVWSVGATQPLH